MASLREHLSGAQCIMVLGEIRPWVDPPWSGNRFENASALLAVTVTGPGSVMSSRQSVMRCASAVRRKRQRSCASCRPLDDAFNPPGGSSGLGLYQMFRGHLR